MVSDADLNRPLDGTLGDRALTFHSDLIFTAKPIEAIVLYATDVENGRTETRFVSGAAGYQAFAPDLRDHVRGRNALALMATHPSERHVPAPLPDFLPRHEREAVIEHPVTGEKILYVTEMQTSRRPGWMLRRAKRRCASCSPYSTRRSACCDTAGTRAIW